MIKLYDDYCSKEITDLLIKKGFSDPTKVYYIDRTSYIVITHQLAMKWLREVHKVLIVIDAYHADHWEGYIDTFEINIYSHATTIIVPNEITLHTNYEEAVEAALKYCLTELI